jgi:uncharacterized protein (DUF1800 family)
MAGILFALLSSPAHALSPQPLTDEQRIIHALNRLGYGARPGDVERVKAMGLDSYLRAQLNPERIDDSAVERKLAALNALEMSSAKLMEQLHEEQRAIAEKKQDKNSTPGSKPAANAGGNLRAMMADGALNEHVSRYAVGQLQNAKIIRAVESNRQLYEVLVDFWSNHFNIDVRKGPCRVLKVVDEREVIRPHVFGKFRDLLGASAKSPAMLTYLDNAQNTAAREMGRMEDAMRQRIRQQVPGAIPEAPADGKPRKVGGINENYAREIMELHTLGVDGGYTQKDVQEVARCFTGWGINLLNGEFEFHAYRHDTGAKTVLGQTIPAHGGIKDGEKVLDLLARRPATAKLIATKLCQRLVADDPPPALVARVAQTFQQTDGDLRKVYEAIIFSPEFNSTAAYRTKIKTPFEFAVSAVRATGSTITTDGPTPLNLRCAIETGATFGRGGDRIANARRKSLNLCIVEMGQPLYAYAAPTGYPEDSRKWVNTGALIARMNFALTLTERGLVDVVPNPTSLLANADTDHPDAVIARLTNVLLQGELTPSTRATLNKQTGAGPDAMATTVNVPQLTALILGSPEFQRH